MRRNRIRDVLGDGGRDIVPQRRRIARRDWCGEGGGQVVEGDVAASFYRPPSTKRTGYPNKIPFCVLSIAEKPARFASSIELGKGIGEDA
jgi:hypothetical protein